MRDYLNMFPQNRYKIFLKHSNLDNDTNNFIRSDIINSINNSTKRLRHITYEDRLFAQRLKSTKTFSKNNNILFTMADKGSVTVALNYNDYNNKMHKVLSDKNTYKKININPLKKMQDNVKILMKR